MEHYENGINETQDCPELSIKDHERDSNVTGFDSIAQLRAVDKVFHKFLMTIVINIGKVFIDSGFAQTTDSVGVRFGVDGAGT